MEILIQKVSHEKVLLTDEQVKHITMKKLYEMLGGDDIEECEGKRVVTSWEDTGHGSGLTRKVREATDLDGAVLLVLRTIAKQKEESK